jgi:hypothetical protein
MRKMKALLSAISLSVAGVVYAESVELTGNSGLDLKTGVAVALEGAPVHVLANRIESAHGIRIEKANAAFSKVLPLMIGTPYLVKDEQGLEYRLFVHAVEGQRRWVEVRPRDSELGTLLKKGGQFKATSFSIDGVVAKVSQRELSVRPDGTYVMGSVQGRWRIDKAALMLDGSFEEWGAGVFDQSGSQLVFRYTRGGKKVELVMKRDLTQASVQTP